MDWWYRKAADQGYEEALEALARLDPKSLELPELILYAVCGRVGLDNIQVGVASGNIEISFHDFVGSKNNSILRHLEKIPSDLLACIQIEGEAIKDANDKQMIISYAYKKLEMVEWYIELITVGSKKYIVSQ